MEMVLEVVPNTPMSGTGDEIDRGMKAATLSDVLFNGGRQSIEEMISKSEHRPKLNQIPRKSTSKVNSNIAKGGPPRPSQRISLTNPLGEASEHGGEYRFRRHRSVVLKSHSTPEHRPRNNSNNNLNKDISATEHVKRSSEGSNNNNNGSLSSSRHRMPLSGGHRAKSITRSSQHGDKRRSRSEERTLPRPGEKPSEQGRGSRTQRSSKDRRSSRTEEGEPRSSSRDRPGGRSRERAGSRRRSVSHDRKRGRRSDIKLSTKGPSATPITPSGQRKSVSRTLKTQKEQESSPKRGKSPSVRRRRASLLSKRMGSGEVLPVEDPIDAATQQARTEDDNGDDSPKMPHVKSPEGKRSSPPTDPQKRKSSAPSPRGQDEQVPGNRTTPENSARTRDETLFRSPNPGEHPKVGGWEKDSILQDNLFFESPFVAEQPKVVGPAEGEVPDTQSGGKETEDKGDAGNALFFASPYFASPKAASPSVEKEVKMKRRSSGGVSVDFDSPIGKVSDQPRFNPIRTAPMTPSPADFMTRSEMKEQNERLTKTDLNGTNHGKKRLLGNLLSKTKHSIFSKLTDDADSVIAEDLVKNPPKGDGNDSMELPTPSTPTVGFSRTGLFESMQDSGLSFDMDLAVPLSNQRLIKHKPRTFFNRAASTKHFVGLGGRQFQSFDELGESATSAMNAAAVATTEKEVDTFAEKEEEEKGQGTPASTTMPKLGDLFGRDNPHKSFGTLEVSEMAFCANSSKLDPFVGEASAVESFDTTIDTSQDRAMLFSIPSLSTSAPFENADTAPKNRSALPDPPGYHSSQDTNVEEMKRKSDSSALEPAQEKKDEAHRRTLGALLSKPHNRGTRPLLLEPSICEDKEFHSGDEKLQLGKLDALLSQPVTRSLSRLPEPSICESTAFDADNNCLPVELEEKNQQFGKLRALLSKPVSRSMSLLPEPSICELTAEVDEIAATARRRPRSNSDDHGRLGSVLSKFDEESAIHSAESDDVSLHQYVQLALPGMKGYDSSSSLAVVEHTFSRDGKREKV